MNVEGLLTGFSYGAVWYFAFANLLYVALLVLAVRQMIRYLRRSRGIDDDEVMRSPLTPGVSIICPAYNEGHGIVSSVQALLALHYPQLEVVVVDDGSTDDTIERLVRSFNLTEVEPMPADGGLAANAIQRTFVSPVEDRLVVLSKENGGKSDALNAGIDAARYELVAVIDADSVLDPNALLRACRPFVDHPLRTVASGGIVRVGNGCRFDRGHLVSASPPRSRLAAIQDVEYLRAFLAGRSAWSGFNALPIVSGAFGIFRRDALQAVGGFDTHTLAEDAELVVRLHEWMHEHRFDYRITLVPDPVCWTEAPEKFAPLRRQRLRWQRGLAQVLARHWRMIGNPRYGTVGTIALPIFTIVELLGPVFEVLGYIAVPVSFALGLVDGSLLLLFLLLAVAVRMMLSAASLALEQAAMRRYPHRRQVLRLLAFAVVESLGYRQLTSWWRLRATLGWLGRRPLGWGEMHHRGMGA